MPEKSLGAAEALIAFFTFSSSIINPFLITPAVCAYTPLDIKL